MSGRIVVGVDGSEESKAALWWALSEARLRQAELHVVYAWTYPVVSRGIGEESRAAPFELLLNDAEELLDATVTDVVGDDPGVPVARAAVEGNPADVLVQACLDADLLVVGSRGRGGIAGLLLGSVSQQCAQHAPCPVVVVRPRSPED